ncbi:MAG: hypothetical protein ACXWJE_06995 [Burkholderiaceae bacterium]
MCVRQGWPTCSSASLFYEILTTIIVAIPIMVTVSAMMITGITIPIGTVHRFITIRRIISDTAR